eukprot:459875_1
MAFLVKRHRFALQRLARRNIWTSEHLSRVSVLRKNIYDQLKNLHTNDSFLSAEISAIEKALNLNIELYDDKDENITLFDQADCVFELDDMIEKLKPLQIKIFLSEPNDKLGCYIHTIAGAVSGINSAYVNACEFADQLSEMYMSFVNKHGGNVEIIYRKKDSGQIKEQIIKCDMENAYGLLKHETGYHKKQCVPTAKNEKTFHMAKIFGVVKVAPDFESIEPYGNLSKYCADIVVFPQNVGAQMYTAEHKPSNIRIRNNMFGMSWSESMQKIYAKETLKYKLIEKAMELNPSQTDEVREYTNTKFDRVVNLKTKYEQKNVFHSVLSGCTLDDFVLDHLNFFKKLPARPLQIDDVKPKKKK